MPVARPPIPTQARQLGARKAWRIVRNVVKVPPTKKAHEAAVAAKQRWKEASAEAVGAVAYATRYYSKWFWSGVGGE